MVSGRSTPWRTMPRGEPRFRASVTSTGWWLAHRKVSWSRAPRFIALFEGVLNVDGSIRRVPVRGRCLGSLQGASFSRGGAGGGLGPLPRFRAAQPPPNGAWCSVGQAKAAPPRAAGGRRQGHQRFDRAVAVGRQRPRLAPVGSPADEDLRSSPIHRSVHRGVKPRSTSGPRKRRRVVPQSSTVRNPENTRDAGFRLDRSGWQKSVRDILAGNALRESARKRACLARRKPLPGIDAVGERGERANRCCSARSRGNSRHVDSGCETSRSGRGTTEGTQVARTRLPKKQARGDDLYLVVYGSSSHRLP
jgi:hypothetical protein